MQNICYIAEIFHGTMLDRCEIRFEAETDWSTHTLRNPGGELKFYGKLARGAKIPETRKIAQVLAVRIFQNY